MAPNMNPFTCKNDFASNNAEKMYLSAEEADVFFNCTSALGEKERIPAHKYILAAKSSIFATIFYGPIEFDGNLNVDGVTPAAFKEFLKIFYVKDAIVSTENAFDVNILWMYYMTTSELADGFDDKLTETQEEEKPDEDELDPMNHITSLLELQQIISNENENLTISEKHQNDFDLNPYNDQITHLLTYQRSNDKMDVDLPLEASEWTSEAPQVAIEKLHLSGKLADFHFICKSRIGHFERISAHKLLLVAVSDVFASMFNGPWAGKDEVKIFDASADAFKEFIQFFYRSNIKLTMNNVAEVMNLGKKFEVAECFDICGKYLKNHLTNDDVCWGYELAIHFDHKDLQRFCEIIIGHHTKAVLASDYFLKCERKTVKRILKMNSLKCSEADLFKALMKWMKVKSKHSHLTREIIRGEFGDLLDEIRFGLMTFQEFALYDLHSIFAYDEYVEINKMIASADYQPKLFNDNRKLRNDQLMNENSEILWCRRLISKICSNTPHYVRGIELTRFSVNEHLWLTSIGADIIFEYRSKSYQFFQSVRSIPSKMTISETSDPVYPGPRNDLHYQVVDLSVCPNGTNILLSKAVLIKPGFTYEIRMEQTPPHFSCTGDILKSVVDIEPGITVQFHNDPTVDGDVVGRGLIYFLTFKKI